MPLYDFRCDKCDNIFEARESYSDLDHMDREKVQCPKCSHFTNIRLPVKLGGYKINGNNSASTRPNGGAFRSKKNG